MQLRWTQERDLAGVDELFAKGFGHGLSRAAWEWKYRAIPGEARSAVAVAEDGRVLAHAGAIGLPARWRGSRDSGGRGDLLWQTVDFVATPRGGGLRPPVVPLMQWIIEDLPRPGDTPWIIGFPNPRNRRLTERILRSGRLGGIRRWVGELAAVEPAQREEGGEVWIESGDSCSIEAPGGGSSDGGAEDLDPGGWAERVWRACGVHGVRRDAAFLNWRYHARPERYYRFYRLSASGVDGLVVVAFCGTEAAVTELWLPPGGAWTGGLAAIAADLRAAGLARWQFWMAPPGTGWLEGLGLVEAEEIHLAYRGRVGQDLAELTGPAQDFYYGMGDFDFH